MHFKVYGNLTIKQISLFIIGALILGMSSVLLAMLTTVCDGFYQNLIKNYSIWWTLLITPVGFAAIIYATTFFSYINGSGIPQVIAVLKVTTREQRHRLLPSKDIIGKFLLTLAVILVGGSVGREGPTVQVGAAILYGMWTLGGFRELPDQRYVKAFVIAGGAAGLSAAFNTPIAGIIFAIEELSRSFDSKFTAVILFTIVLSGLVAQAFLGNYTYFGNSNATFANAIDWLAILVCAIIGGITGGIFSVLLTRGVKFLEPYYRHKPLWVGLVCGIGIALLGILTHGKTFGSGYEQGKVILEAHSYTGEGFFAIPKMFATLLTYLSGVPGGLFAPTLSAGIAYGDILSNVLPFFDYKVVVVLTMTAFFSGVLRSPITCFVIISEMLSEHSMVFPVMASSIIASIVSQLFEKEPLYDILSARYLPAAAENS